MGYNQNWELHLFVQNIVQQFSKTAHLKASNILHSEEDCSWGVSFSNNADFQARTFTFSIIQQPFVAFVQSDALSSAKRPATSMVSNAASGSGLQSSTPELKLSNMEFPGFFSIRMLTFQSRSHPEVKACQKSMSSPRHLAQLPHTLLECSWIQALIPRMIGDWYRVNPVCGLKNVLQFFGVMSLSPSAGEAPGSTRRLSRWSRQSWCTKMPSPADLNWDHSAPHG